MVQVGEHGIKETLEIVDLGMALISAVFQARADGKIDLNDVSYLMPAFMAFPAAITDIGQFMPEVKDLQAEEIEHIKNHVLTKWASIPGVKDNWIRLVGAAFKIGEGIYEGIQAVGDMKKEPEAAV